ncbi:hypothetical protein [Arthrobacter sp. Br18]|uniref:hypothetical protein n=1 Tax=Arthrobacter sp. Br18 TaxID=1312954 RepID=UPI00056CD9F5|nr:hypothetical protein [Arthrobacter sp. Br18]
MAWFWQRLVAYEEGFSGGVDGLGCERVELVEGLDAFDLGDESVDEAEVAGEFCPTQERDDQIGADEIGQLGSECVDLPLVVVDGAARVNDPIVTGDAGGELYGCLVKDFERVSSGGDQSTPSIISRSTATW